MIDARRLTVSAALCLFYCPATRSPFLKPEVLVVLPCCGMLGIVEAN